MVGGLRKNKDGKGGEGGEGRGDMHMTPTHVAMARSCSKLLPLQASPQATQYCLRLSALSSLLMIITPPAPSANEEDEEEDRALI